MTINILVSYHYFCRHYFSILFGGCCVSMYSHPGVDWILKYQNLTKMSIKKNIFYLLHDDFVSCVCIIIIVIIIIVIMYKPIYIYIIVSHDIPLYHLFLLVKSHVFCWWLWGSLPSREPRSLSKGRGQELRRSGSWWHAHLMWGV